MGLTRLNVLEKHREENAMSKMSRNPAERERSVRYEVRREREITRGFAGTPTIEEYLSLDRARLAALGYALNGPTYTGDHFTGRITVHRVISVSGKVCHSELIDVLDERVAFRVLNEIRLPRADKMATSVEQLQREIKCLELTGV